ncbi:MAG: PaaI family thioesterase [Acidimicrobiia bacterium]|nr:PaaI family thioesterase [Acidimicrobiia bacterium]MDH3398391.1 PaaI family thioesterase [Acidimicrobiia bacterium]
MLVAESLQRKWYPDGLCFGCGPANEDGLRLESFPDGNEVVARWSASPIHRAGPEVVAGGIVGTLLDCHTGAAVLRAVWERDGKVPYVDGAPWVTRSYQVELRRATPLDRPIELRAKVVELDEDRAVAQGHIEVDGKVTATIRAEWRRLPN